MAGKVIFDLKKPNTEGEFSIYLVYRYDNKKLVYPTNEKTTKQNWNENTQRLREGRSFPQHKDINNYFDNLASATISIFHKFRNEKLKLDNDIFRIELDEKVKGKVIEVEKITLYQFIESFIKERKVKVTQGTEKINKRFLNLLKAYGKEQGKEIDFADITVEFAYKFIDFMYSEPYEFGTNYTAKMFANLHLFMNEAFDRELHTSRAYKKDIFYIGKTPTYAITLSEKELHKMLNYDFSDNERLSKARDLFLMGCYTGLRFSDFSRLKIEHFSQEQGTTIIQITTQKTKTPVSIPVFPETIQILERNGGEPPVAITNQRLNDYIKEVAQIVGITGNVIFPVNKGGVTKEQIFRRNELVKTHTARRSFATNMILKGFSSHEVMPITGHKSEKEFLNYIRTSANDNAVNVAKKLGI